MNVDYEGFGDIYSKLDSIWMDLAHKLVLENPEELTLKIDTFKENLKGASKGQEFLDIMDETQMIRFLRAGNWDLKQSLSLFLRHMEHTRKFLPYMGGSGFPSEIQGVYNQKLVWVPPYRDQQGRRVLVLR